MKPGTPIYPLFSQYSAFANRDERKEEMTLRDIMTMTAGNACDDNNNDSPGNEDRMQSDATQPDWYKYSLDPPMLKQPGGKDAVYCSGDSTSWEALSLPSHTVGYRSFLSKIWLAPYSLLAII